MTFLLARRIAMLLIFAFMVFSAAVISAVIAMSLGADGFSQGVVFCGAAIGTPALLIWLTPDDEKC